MLDMGKINTKFHLGQLVSLEMDGFEYMHGGGKPESEKTEEDKKGWQNSELVMFPIVGPVSKQTEEVKALYGNLDQHGISRALGWRKAFEGAMRNEFVTQFNQRYGEETIVPNPKYTVGGKSPEVLFMKGDFVLSKIYSVPLNEKGSLLDSMLKLNILVTNFESPGKLLEYQIGWHPAFKPLGDPDAGVFEIQGKEIKLPDLLKQISDEGTYKMVGVDDVHYYNRETGRQFMLDSIGFGNMMIWSPSPDSGMFCIEPVTHIPGMTDSKPLETAKPLREKSYTVGLTLK